FPRFGGTIEARKGKHVLSKCLRVRGAGLSHVAADGNLPVARIQGRAALGERLDLLVQEWKDDCRPGFRVCVLQDKGVELDVLRMAWGRTLPGLAHEVGLEAYASPGAQCFERNVQDRTWVDKLRPLTERRVSWPVLFGI